MPQPTSQTGNGKGTARHAVNERLMHQLY